MTTKVWQKSDYESCLKTLLHFNDQKNLKDLGLVEFDCFLKYENKVFILGFKPIGTRMQYMSFLLKEKETWKKAQTIFNRFSNVVFEYELVPEYSYNEVDWISTTEDFMRTLHNINMIQK